MSELIMVTGEACLDYVSKDIGLIDQNRFGDTYESFIENEQQGIEYYNTVVKRPIPETYMGASFSSFINIHKIPHDTSKRKIGVVKKTYDDGGIEVDILGNETITGIVGYAHELSARARINYTQDPILPTFTKDNDFNAQPQVSDRAPEVGESTCYLGLTQTGDPYIEFDNMIDYDPTELLNDNRWNYSDPNINFKSGEQKLTRDKATTLTFGKGVDFSFKMRTDLIGNPIKYIAGNLYGATVVQVMNAFSVCPKQFEDGNAFYNWVFNFGITIGNTNFVAIPFNIILTNNEQYAQNYLDNGTLPPDAFLYPLDWENLPRYDEPVPTGDEPDDYPNDNDPDDDTRDFDPTPNEIVSYTVNQLTNYNWYWLTVPQWSAFISWFWNDIGNYSDFDDIIAKVKGLYNDVASAVIMCRYYPVDYKWITQKRIEEAPTGNIKLGMIEKAGAVQMIDQEYPLRTEDIGHVHIGEKYKSFMDMSPYSQLSLYLPWHGFIDLDMNLFNGHDVYVKALYDYLSGTIQYYIFYDNELLVNTILCKMAMDIPITLQTKNDRDSAIFNNVSSTIGGLVGAGAGILSGNPIGMTLGVTQGVSAFNSANASALMRLMGNVGESGAYIGCQNCFVVVRRPTIQASDGKKNNTEVDTSIDRLNTWKKNIGMLCGYGYTLSRLKGFTVCHSPRINFTNTAPLQSEVDEIYNYLEKGVIL